MLLLYFFNVGISRYEYFATFWQRYLFQANFAWLPREAAGMSRINGLIF